MTDAHRAAGSDAGVASGRDGGRCAAPDGALSEALTAAAASERLLVALDFDGTLAPFTEDPADSRPLPAAQQALDALVGLPRTTVAVVSGRPLDFLRTVVDPQHRMVLSGSHGAEVDLGPTARGTGGSRIELGDPQRELLDRAVAATRRLVSRHPGSHTELKPAGVAFHTRPLRDPVEAEHALAEMTEEYSRLPGLRVTPGEHVVECSVLSATKGDGLSAIRSAVHPDTTVFAGDDVTDEDALAVLGPRDVGIKVGPKDTVAPWRVPDPAALATALDRLAHERSRLLGAHTGTDAARAAPHAAPDHGATGTP